MTKINLFDAPSNVKLEVIEILAGVIVKKRLISMGIHSGDTLIKFNSSSWGPVLVKNVTQNSSKIAIGKRLAPKIVVGYETA